jgi:hypothetical protein
LWRKIARTISVQLRFLGHLASVTEKLLGPRLAVQAVEKELAKLAEREVAQVFEALRGRIIGGDTLDRSPLERAAWKCS